MGCERESSGEATGEAWYVLDAAATAAARGVGGFVAVVVEIEPDWVG